MVLTDDMVAMVVKKRSFVLIAIIYRHKDNRIKINVLKFCCWVCVQFHFYLLKVVHFLFFQQTKSEKGNNALVLSAGDQRCRWRCVCSSGLGQSHRQRLSGEA